MHLKTRKGAQLLLNGKEFGLELQSDMLELESDHSDISKRSITKIDFQIEENDIETLQKTRITDIQLKAKSYDIIFSKYTTQDEEE